MKYVMTYELAPDGLEHVGAAYEGHRRRLQEFFDAGTLLMAGPWADPTRGAIGIFTTREAAETFIADDPFVTMGVVGAWRVDEWNEVLTD